jgi:hypothetical protein
MVKEDEVLALAEKIKHQRELDGRYQIAWDMLNFLNHEVFVGGGTELRNYISVEFFTIGVSDKHHNHQSHKIINLPVESGAEIINFLLEHTDSKNASAFST